MVKITNYGVGKTDYDETGILTDASPLDQRRAGGMAPADRGRTPRLFQKKTFLYTPGAAGGAFLHHSAGAGLHLYLTGGRPRETALHRGSGCPVRGERLSAAAAPRSAALAIVDTWAYAVPRLDMLEALREDWALNQRFLELCFRKNTVLLGQVRELSFDQAERRIARTPPQSGGPVWAALPGGGAHLHPLYPPGCGRYHQYRPHHHQQR